MKKLCNFDLDNFNYNMESNLIAMGLPVPSTLWGSAATVSATLAAVETALTSKASDVPLGAISKAGHRSKQLMGIGAAYYAGAVIGSALMSTKRATSCSSDELIKAFQDLGFPRWVADDALRHPQSEELLRLH